MHTALSDIIAVGINECRVQAIKIIMTHPANDGTDKQTYTHACKQAPGSQAAAEVTDDDDDDEQIINNLRLTDGDSTCNRGSQICMRLFS